MQKHEMFMSRAIQLSKESVLSGGGPFGAVVVKDGKIVGEGINRVTIFNDPTAHGEIVAIRDACKNLHSFQLEGCTIYTSTEPCPMCLGAIYWARPNAVYYANTKEDAADIGFDDNFIYKELHIPVESRKIFFSQMMRDNAIKIFEMWKKKDDRVDY